jgi:hypothetical protein
MRTTYFYHYEEFTKCFIAKTDAEYDPIGHELMIPANCVTVKPPKCRKYEIAIWCETNDRWLIESNFVGCTVYLKHDCRESVIWHTIGCLPEQFTKNKPKSNYDKWCTVTNTWRFDEQALTSSKLAERHAALCSTDWYVLRFIETGEPIPENVKAYRQKLRDMTSHKNWPKCRLPKLSCS